MDALAIAARLDETVLAQSRELLRHRRLAQFQDLLKLIDGPFAVDQQTKDEKTIFVRDCLKEIGRVSSIVEHGVGVDRRPGKEPLLPFACR